MPVDSYFSFVGSFMFICTGNIKSFRSFAFYASGPEVKRIYFGTQFSDECKVTVYVGVHVEMCY